MTTTLDDWRTVPEWPAYIINADPDNLQVWRNPTTVTGKGGSLRQLAAKQLKPISGRVSLSHEGKRQTFHVLRDLYPITWDDRAKLDRLGGRQPWCRQRHPLMQCLPVLPVPVPKIAWWGSNRVCLRCYPDFTAGDKGSYSTHYGVGKPLDGPASPQPNRLGKYPPRDQAAAEYLRHGGYLIVDLKPSGDFYQLR